MPQRPSRQRLSSNALAMRMLQIELAVDSSCDADILGPIQRKRTGPDTPQEEWIACYPPTVAELSTPPRVRVRLEFMDDAGTTAIVERILESGEIKHSFDPRFDVPSVFIETGLLMPARLAALRLSGGSSRLTDAVQMLTGMDDLVAIGSLVDGLCHKSREYLSYKKKELANGKREFDGCIDTTRTTLADLNVAVGSFTPADTSDNASAMAKFGKQLSEKAAELTKVIESDLGASIALVLQLYFEDSGGSRGLQPPERERICGAFRPGLLLLFRDFKEIQL